MSGELDRERLGDDLGAMMRTAQAYAASEGPEDVADKIIAATVTGLTVVLIVWPRARPVPGIVGVLLGVGHELWRRRRWFGIPV